MHLYSYLQKKNVYVLSSFDCTVMSLHHLIRRFQHSFEVGPISHRRDAKFPRASSVLEWHHANISQLLRNDDAYRLKAVDISAEILRSRNQLLQKCCFFSFSWGSLHWWLFMVCFSNPFSPNHSSLCCQPRPESNHPATVCTEKQVHVNCSCLQVHDDYTLCMIIDMHWCASNRCCYRSPLWCTLNMRSGICLRPNLVFLLWTD